MTNTLHPAADPKGLALLRCSALVVALAILAAVSAHASGLSDDLKDRRARVMSEDRREFHGRHVPAPRPRDLERVAALETADAE